MRASIIIRTYNESEHLPSLLEGLTKQSLPDSEYEIIVVDSGSTDNTLAIAQTHKSRIVHI